MLKKYKGFKITEVDSFRELFVKRKNISVFLDPKGIYNLYSYNDKGYKVKSTNKDLEIALKDIVEQAISEIKKISGFIVTPRISQTAKMTEKTIYWWEKGYSRLLNEQHYKCEVLTSDNYPVESTGQTLKEALENLVSEAESAEQDIVDINKFESLPIETQEKLEELSDEDFHIEFSKL